MIVRHVTFHELAEQGLLDAANYYENQSAGLGSAFLEEIEHAVAQICQHPASAYQILPLVWRKIVRRFPYSIMYSVQDDRIRILAIANQRPCPFYWRGRR
jgi:toxin ParE1/3/4